MELFTHLIYYFLRFKNVSFFWQFEDSLSLFIFDQDCFLVYEYTDEQYVLVTQPFYADQFWAWNFALNLLKKSIAFAAYLRFSFAGLEVGFIYWIFQLEEKMLASLFLLVVCISSFFIATLVGNAIKSSVNIIFRVILLPKHRTYA